jgi:hypothetical protein
LTAEGTIADIKKEKFNFTRDDFLRIVSSIWQTDHQTFIPGLLKVVILFALQLYLFTGARVGSFIPSSEDKHERGLRYKVWNVYCSNLIRVLNFVSAYRLGSVSFIHGSLGGGMESQSSMAQK